MNLLELIYTCAYYLSKYFVYAYYEFDIALIKLEHKLKTSFSNFSELSKYSKEILFEVWNNETFLGLGLVSVNELVLSEHQRMVIPLQGNPGSSYDNSALFGGLLTVHFLITQNEEKSEAQKVFDELRAENDENVNQNHLWIEDSITDTDSGKTKFFSCRACAQIRARPRDS